MQESTDALHQLPIINAMIDGIHRNRFLLRDAGKGTGGGSDVEVEGTHDRSLREPRGKGKRKTFLTY
jgi:hypothetical protein